MRKTLFLTLLAIAAIAVSCKKGKEPQAPKPIAVTEVTLDQSVISLQEGETIQLTATVLPDNADDKSVIWSVDDPLVASVTNGLVEGLMEGTTVVTVTTTDGGKTASCTVNVSANVVAPTSLSFTQTEFNLDVDGAMALVGYLTVDGPAGYDASVVWTSSDPEVASVSEGSELVAKKYGTTTITATAKYGEASATCVVNVFDKPTGIVLLRDGVELSEANPIEFEFSEEATFEVKVLPETAQVRWNFEGEDGDDIKGLFEITGTPTSPTFKAIASGTIRADLYYGSSDNYGGIYEFRVGPQLTITPKVESILAGNTVQLETNIAVETSTWSATYPIASVSPYMGETNSELLMSITDVSDKSATLWVPMFKAKKTSAVNDAQITVTAQTKFQTATCTVTSVAWQPIFIDWDTKQPLDVDEVGVGQSIGIIIGDASGHEILVQDWKPYINLLLDTTDAYSLVSERSDCYVYQFEEGAEEYKITFIGKGDETVKYEQDFAPSL